MSNRLKKFIKRSKLTTLPESLVNIINRQILLERDKHFSKREVIIKTRNFLELLTNSKTDRHELDIAFDEMFDAYNRPHKRDTENIHPSELLSACNRALYYRLTNVPISDNPVKFDAKSYLIFDMGSWFHRYVQGLLRKAGVLEQAEVGFKNTKLRVIGHTDGILLIVGNRYILEIKTINSFGFNRLMKLGKPDDRHVYQASIYAKELGINVIVFLYYNKDTSEMKEFVVDEKTFMEFKDDAYGKIEFINAHVDSGQTPIRICKTVSAEKAKDCVYCTYCFNDKN